MQYFNKENAFNILVKYIVIFVIFLTITNIYSYYFIEPKKSQSRIQELKLEVITELLSEKDFIFSDKDETLFNFQSVKSYYKKIKPFYEKGMFVYEIENQELNIVWSCKNYSRIIIESYEVKEMLSE